MNGQGPSSLPFFVPGAGPPQKNHDLSGSFLVASPALRAGRFTLPGKTLDFQREKL